MRFKGVVFLDSYAKLLYEPSCTLPSPPLCLLSQQTETVRPKSPIHRTRAHLRYFRNRSHHIPQIHTTNRPAPQVSKLDGLDFTPKFCDVGLAVERIHIVFPLADDVFACLGYLALYDLSEIYGGAFSNLGFGSGRSSSLN